MIFPPKLLALTLSLPRTLGKPGSELTVVTWGVLTQIVVVLLIETSLGSGLLCWPVSCQVFANPLILVVATTHGL